MEKGCTEVHPFCLFSVVVLLVSVLIVIAIRLIVLILVLVVVLHSGISFLSYRIRNQRLRS